MVTITIIIIFLWRPEKTSNLHHAKHRGEEERHIDGTKGHSEGQYFILYTFYNLYRIMCNFYLYHYFMEPLNPGGGGQKRH